MGKKIFLLFVLLNLLVQINTQASSCNVQNCAYCRYDDICAICSGAYKTRPDGSCTTCTSSQCTVCPQYNFYCSQCIPGYYVKRDSCVSCGIEGCLQCGETGAFGSIKCSKCKQYYNLVDGACVNDVPCSDNLCTVCSTSNKCAQCYRGYKLYEDGTCGSCNDPYCLACSSADFCTQCFLGTVPVNGVCKLCQVQNCLQCPQGVGICRDCSPGYINYNNERCVICNINGCLECSADNVCSVCDQGNGKVTPNEIGSACVSCNVENCQTCSQADKCTICMEGYRMDSWICYACDTTPNCATCNYAYCTSCKQGFEYDAATKSCVSCNVNKCTSCSGEDICATCAQGYKLYYNQCISCNVDNCQYCQTPDVCSVCLNGDVSYQFSTDGTLCVLCNVENCTSCQADNSCGECGDGYQVSPYISNGNTSSVCITCNVQNCQYCDTTDNCEVCQDNYRAYQGVCVSCPISNCSYCDVADQCAQCLEGYLIYENECFSCDIEKCLECREDNVCNQCQSISNQVDMIVYYPSTNGNTCVLCDISNCASCQKDNSCGECSEGYQKSPYISTADSTVTCVTCNVDNCDYCDTNDNCQSCLVGYDESNGSCIECNIQNCDTCSETNVCSSCINGYTLYQQVCVPCDIAECNLCKEAGICFECSNDNGQYKPSLNSTSCVLCDVEKCLSCTSDNSCGLCQQGLQFLPITPVAQTLTVCISCNVSNCLECDADDNCAVCQDNYYNYEGICIYCPNSNCAVCLQNQVCSECSQNYTLYQNVCYRCDIQQCSQCRANDVCSVCGPKNDQIYYPSTVPTSCVLCDVENCISCDKDNSCGLCQNGYEKYPKTAGETKKCVICQIDNCKECKQDNVCEACADNYDVTEDGQCIRCDPPCATCDSNSTCLTCQVPKYGKTPGTNNECIKSTVPNCLEFNNTNTTQCIECMSGFALNMTTNKCSFLCSPECASCPMEKPTLCTSCAQGFIMIGETCQKCGISDCLTCDESYDICDTCEDGFYLSENMCEPCPDYCATCTSKDVCISLDAPEGKVLIKSKSGSTILAFCASTCIECSSVDPEICIQCRQGYYLANGVCKTCDHSCKTCSSDDPTSCFSCYPGTYKVGTQCLSCNSNCLTCAGADALDTCLTCPDGAFVNSTTNQCEAGCSQNCLACSSPNVCTTCRLGYTLKEKTVNEQVQVTCIPCISACQSCAKGSPNTCLSCGKGLYLTNNESCARCPENCMNCKNSQQCQNCFEGFYVTENKTCTKQCIFPCSQCLADDVSACTSCNIGYELGDNNTCLPVTSCEGGCSACPQGYSLFEKSCVQCTVQNCNKCNPQNTSQCTVCFKGYYQLSNGLCAMCPESCTECVSATVCIKCADGYTYTQKTKVAQGFTCVPCESPCATCSDQTTMCKTCIEGYTMGNGWKCYSQFNYGFEATLGTDMQTFNEKYDQITNQMAATVGSKPEDVTFDSLKEGSVIMSGKVNAKGKSGSAESAQGFNSLSNLLSSGSIGGITVQSSSVVANGGTIADQPQESSSNLGLILGISIPVGVLIIVGISLLVIYLKKKNVSSKQYTDQNRNSASEKNIHNKYQS